jgi:FAD/FMN-containing dehydrogenase
MWKSQKRIAKERKTVTGWGTPEPFLAPAFSQTTVKQLELQIEGTVVLPGDPNYQSARQLANRAFQEFPEIIVYCEVIDDVRACLNFAHEHSLRTVVRSGGHSSAGYSINNGMVLDVSRMSYAVVDTQRNLAIVGAGTTCGHLNATLDTYKLHVPTGACDDICVAGFVQGGGYGFTSRMFGMNCDNVREVIVMLSDCRLVVANEAQNQDLFWAIRGGTGNNFGVLLQITYSLHQLDHLWGFGYSWDIKDAAKVLSLLQSDYMKSGPREICYIAGISFQNKAWVLEVRGMYVGKKSEGKRRLSNLLGIGGHKVLIDKVASFRELSVAMADGFQLPPTLAREDKQSVYISRKLKLKEWQEIIDGFRLTPNEWSNFFIEPYGGQINKVSKTQNAFVHRDTDMDVFLNVYWLDDKERSTAEKFLDSFMTMIDKYSNHQSNQNYPRRSQADYRSRYWGPYFDILREIKKKYDRDLFFRFEQDVAPTNKQLPPQVPVTSVFPDGLPPKIIDWCSKL